MPTLEDFESFSEDEWIRHFSSGRTGMMITNTSYSGSSGGYLGETGAFYGAYSKAFSEPILSFDMYYQEPTTNNGTGFELMSPTGDRVCAFGTANPQLIWTDGSNGYTMDMGYNYDQWVHVHVELDYDKGEVTYNWDQNGSTFSRTASMDNNKPVGRFSIVNANNETPLADRANDNSNATLEIFIDDLTYETSDTYNPIGEIGLDSNGNTTVPVFDSSDYNGEVRVQTDSGVGVLGLDDPQYADNPEVRIQTESGVKSPTNISKTQPSSFTESWESWPNDGHVDYTDGPWWSAWYDQVADGYTAKVTEYGEDLNTPLKLRHDFSGNPQTEVTATQYGYDAVIGPGWEVTMRVYPDEIHDSSFYILVGPGPDNYYRFEDKIWGDDMRIQVSDGGSRSTLTSTGTQLNADEWNYVTVIWESDGDLRFKINGTSINANDTTHTDAQYFAIGWYNGNGASASDRYYDNLDFSKNW